MYDIKCTCKYDNVLVVFTGLYLLASVCNKMLLIFIAINDYNFICYVLFYFRW